MNRVSEKAKIHLLNIRNDNISIKRIRILIIIPACRAEDLVSKHH